MRTNSVVDDWDDGSMGLYVHKDDKAQAGAFYEVMYPTLRDALPEDYTYHFSD